MPTNNDRLLVIALTMVVLAILVFASYVVTVLHTASPVLIAGVITASASLIAAAAGLIRAIRGER